MPARILALDLGTSSTKGLLVDTTGAVLADHAVGYALDAPRPGFAEQDPEAILAAVREVISVVAPRGVDLVFGCAMHTVIGVDACGRPVTPVWTWADRRSAKIAAELRSSPRAAGLHARTGTPIHPMSPMCKLRYVAAHDADLSRRVDRFVSIKEFVIESLFGERCVDESVASCTGLLDVGRREWDAEALELAGITAGKLSPLVPTTHVIDDPAHDRRVVVGATDGVLANLGAGGADGSRACATLGTSGAARLVVDRPATDPRGRLFCYILDAERWVVGGAINNGGLVLRWLREMTAPAEGAPAEGIAPAEGTVPAEGIGANGGSASHGSRDADILREVASVAPGADGLRCAPSLTGERFPSYRADLTASFAGMTAAHTRAHVFRAALEGMMLPFAPLVTELEATRGGARFAEIRIGGGMFQWPFCRQLFADVVGRRVAMTGSRESSALGAARLGFRALGVDHGWSNETPFVHEPDSGRCDVYRAMLVRRADLVAEVSA